jgi:hypothetical protein
MNAAGRAVTEVIRPLTVDTTAPDTSVTLGPSGTARSTSVSLQFSSSESGPTFECRLDDGTWSACTSPKDYSSLSQGNHTFGVSGTDAAGNRDASPAMRSWNVDSIAPTVAEMSTTSARCGRAAPSRCDGKHSERGLCQLHLRRLREYGDVDHVEKPQQPGRGCHVPGCDEPHRAVGLCKRHYEAKRRSRSWEDVTDLMPAWKDGRDWVENWRELRHAESGARWADPDARSWSSAGPTCGPVGRRT